MKLIGTSLSFCIQDIIEGRAPHVDILDDEFLFIVAGTRIKNPQDFIATMEHYSEVYWYANPVEAVKIATRMYLEDRIIQPRLDEKNTWLDCENREFWYELV